MLFLLLYARYQHYIANGITDQSVFAKINHCMPMIDFCSLRSGVKRGLLSFFLPRVISEH